MTYQIIFDKKALNDIIKIEHIVKERIWKKLQECKEDPFRFFEKLVEESIFKLRVGEWRILADINRTNQTINVLKIGHRKNVYENL